MIVSMGKGVQDETCSDKGIPASNDSLKAGTLSRGDAVTTEGL